MSQITWRLSEIILARGLGDYKLKTREKEEWGKRGVENETGEKEMMKNNSMILAGVFFLALLININFASAELNYTTGEIVYGILADTGNTSITGALNLTLQMRSCSLADCSDASWSLFYTNASYTSLASLANASYFQYKAMFFTEDQNYTPYLFNATMGYTYLDTTFPLIDYLSPTPLNNSGASASFAINVSITEEYKIKLKRYEELLRDIERQMMVLKEEIFKIDKKK